jgi:hypothetical protein
MDWLSQRARTILDAFTLRRVVAIPIVIAVITAVVHGSAALSQFILHHEGQMLFGVPSWMYGLLAGLLLLLYFIVEYATRLRLQLEPKLRLSFDPSGGCLVDSPIQHFAPNQNGHMMLVGEARAIFARIRVEALSKTTVRGCSAYITVIETRNDVGIFVRHQIHDPVQLSEGAPALTDIPPRVPKFWISLSCSGNKTLS